MSAQPDTTFGRSAHLQYTCETKKKNPTKYLIYNSIQTTTRFTYYIRNTIRYYIVIYSWIYYIFLNTIIYIFAGTSIIYHPVVSPTKREEALLDFLRIRLLEHITRVKDKTNL